MLRHLQMLMAFEATVADCSLSFRLKIVWQCQDMSCEQPQWPQFYPNDQNPRSKESKESKVARILLPRSSWSAPSTGTPSRNFPSRCIQVQGGGQPGLHILLVDDHATPQLKHRREPKPARFALETGRKKTRLRRLQQLMLGGSQQLLPEGWCWVATYIYLHLLTWWIGGLINGVFPHQQTRINQLGSKPSCHQLSFLGICGSCAEGTCSCFKKLGVTHLDQKIPGQIRTNPSHLVSQWYLSESQWYLLYSIMISHHIQSVSHDLPTC